MSFLKFAKTLIKKIPGATDYYRYLHDSKALNAEVVFREKLGFHFNGSSLMEKGEFEPHETAIVENLFEFFDVFVNIGANTGYYVCKALSRGIPVVAFEPNQLNVNILLKNIEANKFETDFHLFPLALSNKNGVLPMYGASTGASLIYGWAGQQNQYLVPISKFDSIAETLVNSKSCLVLIDIEGSELNCLKGADALIKSSENNVFLIEITVCQHQPSGISINPNLVDTFNLMFSYGYNAFTANKKLRKIEISEVIKVASTKVDTIRAHNFIFTKNVDILKKIIFD